jgi:hypothetical protein
LLMTYLLSNYAHSLDDKAEAQARALELEAATHTLPDFIKAVWKKN